MRQVLISELHSDVATRGRKSKPVASVPDFTAGYPGGPRRGATSSP